MKENYLKIVQTGEIDLSGYRRVAVSGVDARAFLDRILTNHIQTLEEGSGCYTCLCTNKGKIVADFDCYASHDFFVISCAEPLTEKIISVLKRYVILEDVSFSDISERYHALGVIGGRASEKLRIFFPLLPASEYRIQSGIWQNTPFHIIRRKRWNLEGYEIWGKGEDVSALRQALNLPKVDPALEEILRIESATPRYGVDMDECTLPQEANLDHALNFQKGCYVGQETIARLHYRGHVNKMLFLLKLSGQTPPPCGEKIFTPDGLEAGFITSGCQSVKYDAIIALGYIKHAYCDQKEFRVRDQKAECLNL